jgi:uncharacterized membrane protein
MHWVANRTEWLSSTATLQMPISDGLVVVLGLCFALIAGGIVVRYRQNERSEEAQKNNPDSVSKKTVETPVLTNEEQVLRLLESNGGRMRQSHIVEATEWSKSKVSMLLSEMEREGMISKLRVGRENIISRPGFEPEAAHSSLETGA